ncbi:MAG: NYN domain-containing protein [Bradyrhizobiaceae bacterium]|nr:NYN domain-containing protein [Bradyrhizobiaceae bacterium]
MSSPRELIRIGVFYDGNYFLHVSNYYAFNHARQSRISIRGLHEFIRHQVAEEEVAEARHCQIVDSHFFRGRLAAQEAQQRGNLLYYERVFDDILMWEGVYTHYLPVRTTGGKREEKGIDVWMALEAYELTLLKKLDVVVLITSDGDYVPLIRKLNTLGARVMVLAWDFEFVDHEGNRVVTRTSQELIEEVTYPVAMHELLETRSRRNDVLIQNLFVMRDFTPKQGAGFTAGGTIVPGRNYEAEPDSLVSEETYDSEILALKNGYGFIKYPPNNLFFHHSDLIDADFTELREGDAVEFNLAQNSEGEPVAKNVRLIIDDDY